MQPIQIIINEQPFQIGQPLPSSITSLSISHIKFPIPIDPRQVPQIKAWLNQLMDSLDTDWITYNDVLISTEELVKFT